MSKFTDSKTWPTEGASFSVVEVSPEVVEEARNFGFNIVTSSDRVSPRINDDPRNLERATAIYNKIRLKELGISLAELDDRLHELYTGIKEDSFEPLEEVVSEDGRWKLLFHNNESGQSRNYFLEVEGIRKAVVKIKAPISDKSSDPTQSYINEALQLEHIRTNRLSSHVLLPFPIFASQSVLIEEYIGGDKPDESCTETVKTFSLELWKIISERNKVGSVIWKDILPDTMNHYGIKSVPKYENFIMTLEGELYCIDPFMKDRSMYSDFPKPAKSRHERQ